MTRTIGIATEISDFATKVVYVFAYETVKSANSEIRRKEGCSSAYSSIQAETRGNCDKSYEIVRVSNSNSACS